MTLRHHNWATLMALLALAAGVNEAATVAGSEPMAWRFAHPEAQILAGVDFRKLSETADGKQIREQFAAALGAPLLEQAERLLLSSVMESNGRRSDILILSGSFSLPQLRRMAMKEGAKMLPYKGLEIAAPPGAAAGDAHLAWITGPGGGTTVLIGTRPAIQSAGERSKAQVGAMALVNPLFARGRDLASQYPVWVSCETVPAGFGPKELDALTERSEELDLAAVEGFDLGVQAGRTPDLNLWLWTGSEATAEAALRLLQAGVSGMEKYVLSPWMRELKGSIEDGTLVLGAAITPGTVAERVGPLLAAFALPVDVRAPALPKAAEPQMAVRVRVDATVPMTGVAMVNETTMAAIPTARPSAPIAPLPMTAAALARPPVLERAPAAVEMAKTPVPAVAIEVAPKKLFIRVEGLDDGTKDIPYTVKP
jgi:hypothetical protein